MLISFVLNSKDMTFGEQMITIDKYKSMTFIHQQM
jgi:hypothetical protein